MKGQEAQGGGEASVEGVGWRARDKHGLDKDYQQKARRIKQWHTSQSNTVAHNLAGWVLSIVKSEEDSTQSS